MKSKVSSHGEDGQSLKFKFKEGNCNVAKVSLAYTEVRLAIVYTQ